VTIAEDDIVKDSGIRPAEDDSRGAVLVRFERGFPIESFFPEAMLDIAPVSFYFART
jgi:hypothetical protein